MLLAVRNVAPSAILAFKRWTSSSSVLPPEIINAARQQLKAEAESLHTLKIEIPNTENDRRLLVDLKNDALGLWDVREIEARSGMTDKRLYFRFDSHENAARTLNRIRELGKHIEQSWKAQLYPITPSLSVSKPSPVLIIRLGMRGTLNDARLLFRDHDSAPECMPIDTYLSDGMNTCFVRFRTTEHAVAARSWLINEGKTLCQSSPPLTEADIVFSSFSSDCVPFHSGTLRPTRELHISGLGCRVDQEGLRKLLRPFDGVEGFKLRQNWLRYSFGRATVLFETIRHANRAREALDGAYYTESGKRLVVAYSTRINQSNLVEGTPSTLKVQSPVDGSRNYLTHLAKIIRETPGLFHVWDAKSPGGQAVAYLEFDSTDNAQKALTALTAFRGSGSPQKSPLSILLHKPRYYEDVAMETISPPYSSLKATLGARESLSDVVEAYRSLNPLRIRLHDEEDFAFISFKSVEDAIAAYKARNGQPLREGGPASWVRFSGFGDGRGEFAKVPSKRTHDLHIAGLGCRTTKEELRAFCHHMDGFVGCRLKRHWTGRSMGYGYLAYRSTEDAGKALKELHGTVYPHSGAGVRVNYAFEPLVENKYDGLYPE